MQQQTNHLDAPYQEFSSDSRCWGGEWMESSGWWSFSVMRAKCGAAVTCPCAALHHVVCHIQQQHGEGTQGSACAIGRL